MRKNFIPVSGFVDQILPNMAAPDGDLLSALLAQIRQQKKINLRREDFADIELPNHLVTKIKVIDEAGEELGYGTDLHELQKSLGQKLPEQVSQSTQQFGHDLERTGLTDFDLEEFPEQVSIGSELVLIRYPALVDEGESVSVRLLSDSAAASAETSRGLARLYMLRSVQQRNMLRKQFLRFVNRNALILPAQLNDLGEQAVYCIYRAAFAVDANTPRSKSDFDKVLEAGKRVLHRYGDELENLLETILQEQWRIRSQLVQLTSEELSYMRDDISSQLDNLLTENLLRDTPLDWLREFPRYLKAVNVRLEKVPFVGPRDGSQTEELQRIWKRYEKQKEILALKRPTQLQDLRWQIEEYRVSLFAQQLGTRNPVSAKRLEKQFESLERDKT